MTGITKRQVQSGRKDTEGGSGTSKTYGQSTEEMQMKLRRHFNDTYNMNHQWRNSLTRVSVGLSLVLAFRLYRAWDDDHQGGIGRIKPTTTPIQQGLSSDESLSSFLQHNIVECLGTIQGVLVAHYVSKPRDKYPWSFYLALLISIIEIVAFIDIARKPDYVFHVDATLPVGAIYFIFVWGSDTMMNRSLLDAKLGIEASRRLAERVNNGGLKDE